MVIRDWSLYAEQPDFQMSYEPCNVPLEDVPKATQLHRRERNSALSTNQNKTLQSVTLDKERLLFFILHSKIYIEFAQDSTRSTGVECIAAH